MEPIQQGLRLTSDVIKLHVAAQTFVNLQTRDHEDARLDEDEMDIAHFLQALNFLKEHDTENKHEPNFDRSPEITREWV